ncbi:MAG TPA: tetratricopeptide repeat protein [Gammaproteobacteria bacterium]|nr:tetratricopeptide repeat protein [Gammaproteobacteria bacterium]
MAQVCKRPFVIRPPADLLQRHPAIKRAAHELALSYAHNELVTDDRLKAIGDALWGSLALDEAFAKARQYAGNKILPVIIESADATIQTLPWETLHHPECGFLGRENGFSLSRRIPTPAVEPDELQQGPLRVLLFTSLPDDLHPERGRLAVEEEQERVLEALMQGMMEGLVRLETPDDGRFTTLRQKLREFQPHLLFLSGHGRFRQPLDDDGAPHGVFIFEDEQGFSEEVEDTALAGLFSGSGVQCVVLSACESGKAASDALSSGLVRRLIEQQLPHVVGMRESVLDRAGTLFARYFCAAIGRQEQVGVALQEARRAITRPLQESGWHDPKKSNVAELSLGQWSLPTLYSHDIAAPLIDWNFTPRPAQTDVRNRTLDGISLPERFRGRRKELRQLGARLHSSELKQLLITGPGGQGKTALAGKLALEMQKAGWKVLAWSAGESKSWHSFLLDLQLGLNEENGKRFDRIQAKLQDPEQQAGYLLEMLLAQHRGQLLLLLDNLESLQDASSRALTDSGVDAFISAARRLGNNGLTLLLTSRWLLPAWPADHSAARHYPLEHLNYGDFLQLCLLKGEQLAPLARRQQRLRQVYRVLNGNGRGLDFFTAAVQGMALEQEQQFLERLAGAETGLQTDMALELLLAQRSAAELDLLQRMQLFENPVPVEGIIKLATGLTEPERLLSELVAVSLVEKSHHPHWMADEYHCPTLVTQAVNRKLQSEPETLHAQLAADYQLYLFRNERPTLGQAQIVHPALQRAGQRKRAHRFALDVIVGQLSLGGLYQTLLDEWLPPIRQSENPQIRAEGLGQTGKQLLHLGQYETALSYLNQSLAIRQEIGDRSGEGTTLNNISQIFNARGDYETALSYLEQSLVIQRDIGDRSGEAATRNNISQIYDARGDYETTLSYLEQSLVIQRDIGDRFGEGRTRNNISQIYHAREDYRSALNYLEESLAIQREIRDRSGEGTTLNNISQIYCVWEDYEKALSYLKQSLAIRQEIGDRFGEGSTRNNIAQIYCARGDYRTALNYLKESLAIRQEIGDTAGSCTTLFNMGHIHYRNGERSEAFSAWITVYELAKPMGLAEGLKVLEELAKQLGLEGGLAAWETLADRRKLWRTHMK